MLIVTQDIYSNASRGLLYAAKYSRITVVSDRGHVLIAEDIRGNRFPVLASLIIDINESKAMAFGKEVARLRELQELHKSPVNEARIKKQELIIENIIRFVRMTNGVTQQLNF